MAVVAYLHGPLGDVAHVTYPGALAHRQARAPDGGARAHGGGEAVCSAYYLFGVSQDGIPRSDLDEAVFGVVWPQPEGRSVLLVGEVDGDHVVVRHVEVGPQAHVVA